MSALHRVVQFLVGCFTRKKMALALERLPLTLVVGSVSHDTTLARRMARQEVDSMDFKLLLQET